MRRNERCPRPETEGTAKVHMGDGTDPILPRHPDSWVARAYRAVVLRFDAVDLVALAAVVLWLPLAVGR